MPEEMDGSEFAKLDVPTPPLELDDEDCEAEIPEKREDRDCVRNPDAMAPAAPSDMKDSFDIRMPPAWPGHLSVFKHVACPIYFIAREGSAAEFVG